MDSDPATRSSVIDRTRSDQLEVLKSLSRTASTETEFSSELNAGARKSKVVGSSRSPAKRGSYHIRKSRSTQLNKVDLEEVSNVALSRASSASLGFSFSFTGFTPPPQGVADLNSSLSDDDISPAGDLESNIKRKNFIVEPTLPISLKFTDVKYKVFIKGVTTTNEKYILHGISGSASPGEVVALMGPSGCGKTSLLSLLGGRISDHAVEGLVTYNEETYNKSLKRRIGFVTQDDVLFAHLTVKETLTYAALLLLPKTMTKQQKEDRAMDVIYELGLERCQNTMIGGSFVRGVSGGERKRVCIGCEIIINPSLLFLDEPTSGLDSTTALRIVQVLHNIAEAGKTVVTTIHQPSSRLFHKFNKLILLGKGSLLYFGKASEAMPYFESIGCSPLIAMNPAEFLLDLANGNLTDISIPSELHDEVQTKDVATDAKSNKPSANDVHEYLVGAYENKMKSKEKKTLVSEDFKECVPSQPQKKMKRAWGASWGQQYIILFFRGIKERRHDYLSWMRITQVVATALILGLLWWHSNTATPKALKDQAGLLFFIAVFWGFFPVFTAIFTFPQERAMLNKERAVDMYKLSAYFMARTTSDMPLDLLLPIIFLLIVYFMAGLRQTATAFFLTMLIVFLCIVAAQGLGLAIGATLLDIKKATTLASVTVMTFMLAGGFFVTRVPSFISWLRYLSFNYHTYRLLLKVQYDEVPLYLNVTDMDKGLREVVALIIMVFGYRLLAYISLRRTNLRSAS